MDVVVLVNCLPELHIVTTLNTTFAYESTGFYFIYSR